ncbi:MAG: 6-hydroxymethylpterin diphosphokinase MptE-like protein [Arcobacteraceae bacterium]
MDIDLAEIEQSLVMVYQKNLQFLKENFFDIFEEVDQFSKDLEAGKIKEKYSLEMKNGYFDIQNLEDGGYYYATNSYIDAETRAALVDFTANSSLDLLRKDSISQKLSMPYGLGEVLPVVDFINQKVDLQNVEFQKIMKLVYIGVGLGYHIQEMDKKLESYTTLIIEPELEIFRLSLFTMDYSIFEEGNRTLVLSVGNDKNIREQAFSKFYSIHSYMNYNIKYQKLLQNLDYIKTELIDFCENHFAGAFPYKAVIKNVKRTIGFIKNEDKFLVLNDILEKKIFKNKEILLISAGPSLDNYIEIIKKYQDRYIITCVDVIVRKLEKNGIVPDIVFSIDPSHLCEKYLKTEDPEYLKNSAIVLLSQQHPDLMKLLRERKLHYYISQFAAINKEIGCLGSVPNVGTFSFHAMAHLGGKKLYTIGNDAAFNQETGSRYSSDSSHTQSEVLEIDDKNDNVISKEDLLEVKGNLKDTVKTNRSLIAFKLSYDQIINNMKSYLEYDAYNLSDGVYIDGLTPMREKEFIQLSETLDTKDIDVINTFENISKVLDADCYENDIKIINSIIQRAKKFQKQKIISRDDFLTKKLDLMIWILEKSKEQSIDLFGAIFLQYTDLVDAYINFTINLKQKDLYTQKNLELLRDYWAKGVISVFRDMKDSVVSK